MRRLLTAGIFGTILGIVGAGTANASIVSSGFLDEKLTEYALSTSLGLKANQSDFIELNTQISDSVDNLKSLWGAEIGDLAYGFNPNKVNNNINGAFDLVEGFILHSMLSLTGGWTDSVSGQTYLGLKGINATIGTLPSGNFPEFPKYEDFFSRFKHPLTYPTSLAELITAIYGNSETRVNGLLSAIITGFSLDRDGDGIHDSQAGLIPNLDLATRTNDLAKANAAKIGDLPTEYATVGAALTAIKGIAEDAKAAALAAIPDPKTEGSTGKFVLTVDIVGDNATYRWEKIDREGEATTTE